MRKVRFRQWDTNNNRFTYWGFNSHESFSSPATSNGVWLETPQEQYTGLKDKNGVEIFEGDIVRRGKHIGVVTYVAPGYVMKCSSYEPLRAIGVCEVIGNVHDNPGLIERSSDDRS